MSRRRIGQESFGFGDAGRRHSSLDDLAKLIDWASVDHRLVDISCAAKGEPAWPPLALFKALLLAAWYDLSDVKLADRVKIIGHAKSAPSSLHDEHGAQQRWAKKRELDEVMREGASLPAGDSKATKPPKKPKGGEWEKPKGDAEKMIVDLLSARLVGESHDEKAGYYVPPVDVSTVAAHLELFHGGIPDAVSDDEGRMLAMHGAQHEAAATGAGVLAVNHWHTAKRP